MKAQLRRADRLGARLVGVVGDDELARGGLMLKDMAAGTQRPITLAELEPALRSGASVAS